MFKNYLKIAFRNLFKERLISLINIIGLSIGTAVVILIFLYVKNEWSFDRFHSNSKLIYRTWVKEHIKGELIFNSITPLLLGPELENNFPEIEKTVRYLIFNNLIQKENFLEEEEVHYVDSSFLQIFDFPLKLGEKDQVFSNLNQIVITEKIGKKYFGDTAPIGQSLSLQIGGEWTDFLVSGIIADPPENSSIQYEILAPIQNTFKIFGENTLRCWTCVFGETYVQIDPQVNVEELNSKIATFIDDRVSDFYGPGEYVVGLQPLSDIHLNNEIPQGIVAVSDARYPYILGSIALLIIILACINFTVLSIGRSVTRAKEVGVRKVTGATKWQLRIQFWSEAVLTTFLALAIGVLLSLVLLPSFNYLADRQLSFSFNITNILFCIGLAMIIGLLSSVYPALVLSGFAPIEAVKGISSKIGTDKHKILKTLIGFQFVLSIILVTCTLGMQKQMRFLQNKNLGYVTDELVIVPFGRFNQPLSDHWEEAIAVKERLKNDLLGKGVSNVLLSSHTFGTPGWLQVGFTDRNSNRFRQFRVQQIGYDYLEVMKIKLLSGRKFSKENITDKRGVIVNQAFIEAWELERPIGQPLPEPFTDFRIIGVSEDFNFASLHDPVGPLVMTTDFVPLINSASDHGIIDPPIPKFTFQLKGENLNEILADIENSWKKLVPGKQFSFQFMDEDLNQQYQSEQKLSSILGYATALAILIACLGLLGITTLTTAQKKKEIGMRKVLGASVANIVLILIRNFTAPVMIASVVAIPIAWYVMKEWLKDFAFRTNLSIWIFVIAALIILVISLITVSFQSVKAALMNPVDAIRQE